MHTVQIEGKVPTVAAYMNFTDGQDTAFTYFTTGSYTGSFNIFSESYLKPFAQSPFVWLNKTMYNLFSPGQANFLQ